MIFLLHKLIRGNSPVHFHGQGSIIFLYTSGLFFFFCISSRTRIYDVSSHKLIRRDQLLYILQALRVVKIIFLYTSGFFFFSEGLDTSTRSRAYEVSLHTQVGCKRFP